mmetsp:Transcript_14841/g.44019  ORF Transcript_14841/g.44019 Transcript_14841/m.44019 type:complete len:344 (-) Transcript_14841:564-1595(-)
MRQAVALGAIVRPEPLQCPLELHELRAPAELVAESSVTGFQVPEAPSRRLFLRLDALDPLGRSTPYTQARAWRVRALVLVLAVAWLWRSRHAKGGAAQMDNVLDPQLLGQLRTHQAPVRQNVQPLQLQFASGQASRDQDGDALLWSAILWQPSERRVAVARRKYHRPIEEHHRSAARTCRHLEAIEVTERVDGRLAGSVSPEPQVGELLPRGVLQRGPGSGQHLQGAAWFGGEAHGAQRQDQGAHRALRHLEDVAVLGPALRMAPPHSQSPTWLQQQAEDVDDAISEHQGKEKSAATVGRAVRRQRPQQSVVDLAVLDARKTALAKNHRARSSEADVVQAYAG